MNSDSLRFGIRYSDAGIATRSYVTLYIITRRLSMRLWSMDASVGFRAFSHTWGLRIVTTGPPGSPALNWLDFVCVETKQWRHIPTAV